MVALPQALLADGRTGMQTLVMLDSDATDERDTVTSAVGAGD